MTAKKYLNGELVDLTPEEAAALSVGPTVAELKDYAASKRRQLVNGAALINVGARSIPTWVDPESRGSVTGLVVASNIVPNLTSTWKGSNGAFYTLSTAEIAALALGMMQFVNDCFDAERVIAAAIDAATITTADQVDGASWPAPA